MVEISGKPATNGAMKWMIQIVLVLTTAVLLSNADFGETNWHKWREVRDKDLHAALNMPREDQVPALGRLVLAAGPRPHYPPAPALKTEFFELVRHEMTQRPGHAEYYGDRIRSAYVDFRAFHETLDPAKNFAINVLHDEMTQGFGTLRHLSSPESVKVLGDMLEETWQAPIPHGAEYYPPALASEAVTAIANLSFRNPPAGSEILNSEMIAQALPEWQRWYAEVAAGKKAFSFKGQAVEYRFRPDGTWETIAMANPPDDGPKQVPSNPETMRSDKSLPPSPPVPAPLSPPAPTASSSFFGLIVGGVILLLAVAVLLIRRNVR